MLASLRKFGLQHHDLPTMLGNIATLLRLLALDVDSRNTTRTPATTYITFIIILFFYLYVYHVSTYWYVFCRSGEDLISDIVVISLSMNSSIGIIKLIFMHVNSIKVRKLVSGYLKHDAALAPLSGISENVNATLRVVKKRAFIFWVIVVGNGTVYAVAPVFKSGRHLPEERQILFGLEPMHDSPNFEMAYTAVLFAIFTTVYTAANITGFIIIIVGYSEAQMLALGQELNHLWLDARTHYKPTHVNLVNPNNDNSNCINKNDEKIENSKKINHYIRYRLISIMKTHSTNFNLIMQAESIFKAPLAVEFGLLSSGIILALLGGLENTYIQLPFGFVQVAVDCLAGQRLMDANKAFEEAVYGCSWEQFDVGNRRLVLMMLLNAQKTMKLSAGGIACLSYTSLMVVFKSIYSAYAALRSTMK